MSMSKKRRASMRMIRWSSLMVAVLFLTQAAGAQTPVEQLATPPSDAQRFTVLSTGGIHGSSALWTTADGTRTSRDSIRLRGQVFEIDQQTQLGPDAMPRRVVVRGSTPRGDAAESFTVESGRAQWRSQVDAGEIAYPKPAFYVGQNGTFDSTALLIERLLTAPERTLALLPSGRAHAERLTEATVGKGSSRKTVVAWSITGLSNAPVALWTTHDGRFFASLVGLAVLPVGYEDALTQLTQAQDEALAALSPGLVRSIVKTPAAPVAFTRVRLYDADARRFVPDTTVVIADGKIVQVGPAASTKLPAAALVIDGAGKTLLPGLWDSHMHVENDASGPLLLSLGITSARDPGNDNALTLARAHRRAEGLLLSPKIYPSVLIDGQGPHTAQVATAVGSQAEAIAAIDKAKADGFTGIKFYGTFSPAWLAPSIAQAHRLGLHVHGHVPAGMRPLDVIAAGYDEITHANMMMMQAMPEEVVAHSNGIVRIEGVGRYARNVDLDAAPMRDLVAEMARRKITADPTLVVYEGLFVPDAGDMSPAYAPFVGTLPPVTERGFRTGGFAISKELTREDYRQSFAKLSQLVKRLHDAGVPIVAGTDGTGMELVRELELYVAAGMTTADALATATIAPARLVGADQRTGSIAVGKNADLVLVEGDPSVRIGDLRNTRVVMMDGKLMDADALRAAAGMSGRPAMLQ
jgi:imidazolonepropionase-like amidohydrolase